MIKRKPLSTPHKEKIRLALIGRSPWNKGLTKEIDSRIKSPNLGKIMSKEHKNKISLGVKINLPSTAYKKGYHPVTEFKKGHKPMNGFKKGYCPLGSEKSWFKKGQSAWNKGIIGKESHIYGKIRSEETREKDRVHRALQIFPVKDTLIEVKIQNFLKQMNIEFFTHKYMKEIEHSYQCDIFIPSMNIVIECDGNYYHNYPLGNPLDIIRSNELRAKGFKVIRLWESEINAIEPYEFKQLLNKVNPVS